MSNGSIGSVPQHPIIAKMLELSLANVQKIHYGPTALDAAANVCVFGRAIHESEKERNSTWFSSIAGRGGPGWTIKWNGSLIVQHKCEGCGGGQDWGATGNNYFRIWKERKNYCEDAASLFQTW